MSKITIYACIDSKFGLSKDGKLPWRIPEEMSTFLRSIEGTVCFVTRPTWEGLPVSFKRDNICYVYTRNPDEFDAGDFKENTFAFDNVVNMVAAVPTRKDISIIGGPVLYDLGLEMFGDVLHLSRLPSDYNCDVYFPVEKLKNWELVSFIHQSCPTSFNNYKLEIYKRKENV